VFAPQLGLDANQDWGPSRLLLLAAGFLIAGLGWLEDVLRSLGAATHRAWGRGRVAADGLLARSGISDLVRRLDADWASSSLARQARLSKDAVLSAGRALLARYPLLGPWFGTHRARISFASWLAFALVSLSYVWFVSVGTWVRWPGTSAYHDLQAEAFLQGQTHLLLEPPAELLALPDPYDPSARSGLTYLWDASLYRGRYYIYWGPVPALLLVPVKALADVRVGDDVLVLAFSVGTLFWATRILTRLWRDSFPEVPGWALVGSVLIVGWANPATWLLNSPWVYESAIAGGQFFLVMGLAALVSVLQAGSARPFNLIWAGISLALAVGTRFSLAAPVAVVTLIVLLRFFLPPIPSGRRLSSALALLLPLVLGAAALAGYNVVRFGSATELGHSYQLTSLNLEEAGLSTTSLGNIPPNLYNYLLNPVRRLAVFPYVKPRWGGTYMSVLRLPVPEAYYSRQITGLLWAAPFAFFSLTGIVGLWKRFARVPGRTARMKEAILSSDGSGWIRAAVLGSSLAGFAIVQLYLVGSMRYQADFIPTMMLAATIGFWGGLRARRRAGKSDSVFALAGLASMMWTVAAGLLLGITSYHARFEKLNPDLFRWLTDVFTL
jgi:hypothetical protein